MKPGKGFARPVIERKPRAPVTPWPFNERPAAVMRRADGKDRMSVPVPKREYVRSKKLMEAYRQIPCQHCGIDDGTVCGAHSNWAEHGKGRSIKASDDKCASLCYSCHTALDQGVLHPEVDRRGMWEAAHAKTVDELTKRGLWPASIERKD